MVTNWKNLKGILTGQKDLASIGFANLVGSGLGAIFWFYLASQISPGDYGIIHYFLGIAGMAQLISLISTPNSITVYTAKKIKIESTLFLLSISAGIISSIIVFILFERIDVSLLILGYIVFELVNATLIGKKLFNKYAIFFLIQKSLTLVLGIGFYFIFGFEGVISALVLSFIPTIWILFSEFKKSKIDFSLLKPRKGFIANNYGVNLSGAFSSQIDKIIIAPILGFELLGNYALALQFFVVLMMGSTIIFKYLLTQESSGYDTKKLRIITILLSVIIAIFGVYVLPQVIPILFPEFVSSIDAIRIISLVVIPATIALIYESKFLSLEKSKFLVISKSISAMMLIAGFLTLGLQFEIIGLSLSLLFSTSFQAIFLVVSNRIFIHNKMKNGETL